MRNLAIALGLTLLTGCATLIAPDHPIGHHGWQPSCIPYGPYPQECLGQALKVEDER